MHLLTSYLLVVTQRGYLWVEGKEECVHIHLAPQGSHITRPRGANDDCHGLQRAQHRREGYVRRLPGKSFLRADRRGSTTTKEPAYVYVSP